jgi:hypothetical protein
MDPEIGQAAGEIWRRLAEQQKPITLTTLKRTTKLSDQLLLMGLGWLAREDKLALVRRARGLEISLHEP